MSEKIERFKISNLRNMEYTLVVPRIIDIVESHDPDTLRIRKSLNRVKAWLPDLDRIEAMVRKWAFSDQLDEAELTRDEMVNTLIRTERNYDRVTVPGYEQAALTLTGLFDKHRRDIATDTDTAETKRIYKLVEDVEGHPELVGALNTFALMPVFNCMKEANIRFDELWRKRNKELSEKDRVDTKKIRSGCDKTLTSLMNAIEYCSGEYEDINYKPLADELNRLSAFYRQQLKARATRSKNGEKTDNEVIKPEA